MLSVCFVYLFVWFKGLMFLGFWFVGFVLFVVGLLFVCVGESGRVASAAFVS